MSFQLVWELKSTGLAEMPGPVCPGNGLIMHVSGTVDSGTYVGDVTLAFLACFSEQ